METNDTLHSNPLIIAMQIHATGRKLAPVLKSELPTLLGKRAASVAGTLATWAETRMLLLPAARSAIAAILVHCECAIRAGTDVRTDWHVARHIGGEEEWECREVAVLTEEARRVAWIRERLAEIEEMIERIDDLQCAQNAIDMQPG